MAAQEVKIRDPDHDNSALLIIILLFITLLVPLRLLVAGFEELARQNAAWHQAEIRARLRNEMMLFKKDLQLESFVEAYLRQRLAKLELASEMAEVCLADKRHQRKRRFDRLFAKVEQALQKGKDAVPLLFLVMADNRYADFRFRIEPELARRAGDEAAAAQFISLYTLRNQEAKLDKKTTKHFKKITSGWGGTDSTRNGLHKKFRQILSSYIGRDVKERQTSVYYSDLCNFDNILFWFQPIETKDRYFGSLAVGILAGEISDELVLQQALSTGRDKNIRRIASWQSPFADDKCAKRFCESIVLGGRQLYLGVVEESSVEANFSSVLDALRFLTGVLLLMGFLALAYVWLFGLRIQLKLRAKLAAVLALVVFIPAILVAVLTRASLKEYLASRIDMAQAHLTSRIDEIELGLDELVSRQVLRGLKFKFHLQKLWGGGLKTDQLPDFIPRYLKSFTGRNYFYDRKGESLHFRGSIREGHADRLTINNAVRLLSSLSGLQPGSRTKKQLDQLHYTDAFVSDMNLYTSMSSVVAKESEVVSNLSSLNLLSRDIVALYANPFRRPIRAGSIGFLKMNPNWVAAKYITTSPGFPYAYFSEVDGNYHTRFAFALRDNEFISEEFWLNKNSRRDADLKMLFARAMDSKSSGSSLAEDEPEKVMAWLFRSEWEHLLVGVTTFSPDSYIALFFDLVPYVVFIYSLIIALVISALLAGLLLPPIDAVGQGVRAVEAGEDLTLRVQLANNDEFDRMGEAFNEMTAGLLQKRHISRFVSDRLLSEIASTCNLSETREERATVLASDLRNFTGISEKFPPEMVVEVLNDYFTEMEQAIKTENGSIDKFIGDAIIAVFYRQHGEKTELRAVRAALAMRHRLAGFNQRQLALGRFAIENGVGLATGSVVSTVLGSLGRRREFVITGAPLEDAERLEALSKLGRHSRIIVDAATLAALKPYCSFEQLSAEPALHEIVEMKP